MKFEIFKFEEVTSTNDVAINLIKNKKKEIGCVYADTQTKGRGTHGKNWFSEKGNLFATIFFPLNENHPPFNEFSIINPTIILRAVEKFFHGSKATFKWPNDLLINGKKFCGILQELITFETKKFLIIGIGLNIVSNPKLEGNNLATNIFLETKNKPTPNDVISLITTSYESFFSDLNIYNYESFKKKIGLI